MAYLKKNKIEILGLKILTIKIENSMDAYNNKLGTAEKKSVNWGDTSKETMQSNVTKEGVRDMDDNTVKRSNIYLFPFSEEECGRSNI